VFWSKPWYVYIYIYLFIYRSTRYSSFRSINNIYTRTPRSYRFLAGELRSDKATFRIELCIYFYFCSLYFFVSRFSLLNIFFYSKLKFNSSKSKSIRQFLYNFRYIFETQTVPILLQNRSLYYIYTFVIYKKLFDFVFQLGITSSGYRSIYERKKKRLYSLIFEHIILDTQFLKITWAKKLTDPSQWLFL